jgi:hypothetical protein
MTEDKFEDFLKKAAQGYNAPPARTPREDMWSAIQAQRAAGPRVVYGGGSPVRESSPKRFGSRIWIGAAAAAVLLLATGVGLGRWSASSSTPPTVATVSPPKTVSPSSAIPEPVNTGTSEIPTVATNPSKGSASGAANSGVRVATGGGSLQPRSGGNSPSDIRKELPNNAASPAYQLAAVRHLSEAEALLTSFRTRSNADQQMDAQLGSWARELLSNTRLLLDSPVANDPQRRPLLEDLELVLVQIVQLSPGSTPQDRDLIEKTLQQDHVMTRLRTAIPAGSQRGS